MKEDEERQRVRVQLSVCETEWQVKNGEKLEEAVMVLETLMAKVLQMQVLMLTTLAAVTY